MYRKWNKVKCFGDNKNDFFSMQMITFEYENLLKCMSFHKYSKYITALKTAQHPKTIIISSNIKTFRLKFKKTSFFSLKL